MSKIAFDWDPRKAAGNHLKHGVLFEDAVTVFDDPLVLLVADLDRGEPRVTAIGTAKSARVLFVVTFEVEEDVLRIISARRATRSERRRYEEDE